MEVIRKLEEVAEQYLYTYYEIEMKVRDNSRLKTHMDYILRETPLNNICDHLVRLWSPELGYGFGELWRYVNDNIPLPEVIEQYNEVLDKVIEWYDMGVEKYGLPTQHTAFYDVRPAIKRLRKSIQYVKIHNDNPSHYKTKYRTDVFIRRMERLAHEKQQRNLRWGIIRTVPMLMLWRKRATERVFHPDNMREWIRLQIN